MSRVITQLHISGVIQGQGLGWKQQTPDPRHPTFSHFMNRFLQRLRGLYLIKVLKNSGIKKPSDLPILQGNVHGKKGGCMHYMIANCSNPSCQLYHLPATEIEPWYVEAVCCMIVPGLDHIMKQGVSDIHI